ncbi:hypothetical protein Q3V94_13625 [Caloramator sp. CAR-1]|uniref:hypothetical protein n=1 Tax=Caloramator sp. CAR-1 TaxID=3062777 RepID=UPI0026E33425|nr:hypothetical protein [Caloramator sp. CAR-1]MDO6355129.1 hypothetical protein [Caloramator sp. CAR-1]MDO6356090.1 hypothetical protein [Caloramator sp. CAR-1]
MHPEAIKYTACAIVDLLANDLIRFKINAEKAAKIHKQQSNICECGMVLIEGKMKHGKDKISIKLCTVCGQVYKDGEKLMKIRRVKVC